MIAIAGGKGGCGKTTTTVGLARALASRTSAPVVGIEGDWDMPNLRSLARIAPTSAPVHVSTIPDAPGSIRTGGLTILDAPPAGERNRARAAYERLDRDLRTRTPWAVIDCPAGAGRDAAVPIDVATGVVLVSTDEPASLRDAAKTAAMARTLGTPVLGGVLTKTERVPDGTERLLGGEIVPVPEASDPLAATPIEAAYGHVATLLDDRR